MADIILTDHDSNFENQSKDNRCLSAKIDQAENTVQ